MRALSELGGGLNQPRADRVHVIRRPGAFRRGTNIGKAVEIADDDLGAAVTQLGGTVIQTMHQRPHAMATLEQQACGMAARLAGGSGDEQS